VAGGDFTAGADRMQQTKRYFTGLLALAHNMQEGKNMNPNVSTKNRIKGDLWENQAEVISHSMELSPS